MFADEIALLDFIERNSHAETRYCEFKGNVSWNDVKYKIVKTILGMSNVRDGGYIVIGVEWNQLLNKFQIVGLSSTNNHSYDNDRISQIANNFADTHAEINVKHFVVNKKFLVVIEIHEYGEIVICRQDQNNGRELILENGAVYTRRHRKPETTKCSSVEMREILQAVSERLLRYEIRRFQELGIIPHHNISNPMQTQADSIQFANERGIF